MLLPCLPDRSLSGLFCSEMKRVNPIKRTVESVCKPYIDLLHVDIIMETAYLQKPVEEPAKTAEEEIDIEHEAALLRGLTLNQTMAKETEMKVYPFKWITERVKSCLVDDGERSEYL